MHFILDRFTTLFNQFLPCLQLPHCSWTEQSITLSIRFSFVVRLVTRFWRFCNFWTWITAWRMSIQWWQEKNASSQRIMRFLSFATTIPRMFMNQTQKRSFGIFRRCSSLIATILKKWANNHSPQKSWNGSTISTRRWFHQWVCIRRLPLETSSWHFPSSLPVGGYIALCMIHCVPWALPAALWVTWLLLTTPVL